MEEWSMFLFTIAFGEGLVGIFLYYLLGMLGRHVHLFQFVLIWQAISIPLTVIIFWLIGHHHSKYAMTDKDFKELTNSKTPGKFAELVKRH